LGSVWVANETLLPGFVGTRQTADTRNPCIPATRWTGQRWPDGHLAIPKPCVAGSIPARGATKQLLEVALLGSDSFDEVIRENGADDLPPAVPSVFDRFSGLVPGVHHFDSYTELCHTIFVAPT
jgi:hypothetical protein